MTDTRVMNRTWEEMKKILPDLIVGYEKDIAECRERILIQGKSADQAYKDQTAWPVYYGMRKSEVRKLLKQLEAKVRDARSRQYKQLTEAHQRSLSTTDKEHYVDSNPEYLQFQELYLEVEELYDKFSAICDAFTARGFALRDWKELRIQSLHNDII